MAHRSLVNGTIYEITGGKSMVSGTTFSIAGGRTLVNGTGYSIGFGSSLTAMLYSDGDFVVQMGSNVQSGKTLEFKESGLEGKVFEQAETIPWYNERNSIVNVQFQNDLPITELGHWFDGCTELKTANLGNNLNEVINIAYLYYQCQNLTGSPVVGNNVTNMSNAYSFCDNLTGSPVCGNNVTNMAYTYYFCFKLHGNAYFYSPNVSNMRSCFYSRDDYNRLNIYLPENSTTLTTALINNTWSMIGENITWTKTGVNYYNTSANIYLYPVANVEAARLANGD